MSELISKAKESDSNSRTSLGMVLGWILVLVVTGVLIQYVYQLTGTEEVPDPLVLARDQTLSKNRATQNALAENYQVDPKGRIRIPLNVAKSYWLKAYHSKETLE